jgi:hypothetical protein
MNNETTFNDNVLKRSNDIKTEIIKVKIAIMVNQQAANDIKHQSENKLFVLLNKQHTEISDETELILYILNLNITHLIERKNNLLYELECLPIKQQF